MRRGSWSPTYKKTNTYNLEHYLIGHFGDLPLRNLSTFGIQVWLNNLVEEKDYSDSVVRSCFNNIRAITHLARKQKFLVEDPGEDVVMPITRGADRPVMAVDLMLLLLGAMEDLGDLCLMLVGIFSGPRASEAMGFQWKSWTGVSLMPHGTAVGGQFYEGRLKSKASRAPIAVPEPVRPVIEAWRRICSDPSPEALMFPTLGAGSARARLYRATRRTSLSGEFVQSRRDWGFPSASLPFRSCGVRWEPPFGSRDAQGHAGRITPCQHHDDRQCICAGRGRERDAGDQLSRDEVLEGWTPAVETMGLTGRNLKRLPEPTQGA
jgi:hypothetical protein